MGLVRGREKKKGKRKPGGTLRKSDFLQCVCGDRSQRALRCACRRAPHLCTAAHRCACTAGENRRARASPGSLQTGFKTFPCLFSFFWYELCGAAVRVLRPETSPPSLRYCTEQHRALCSCMRASDYAKAPTRRTTGMKISLM